MKLKIRSFFEACAYLLFFVCVSRSFDEMNAMILSFLLMKYIIREAEEKASRKGGAE